MANQTRGCINSTLGIDEACLVLKDLTNYPAIFHAIAREAYMGLGFPLANLEPGTNTSLIISTKRPLHIYYQTIEDGQYRDNCHTAYNFKEHGLYRWNLSDGGICHEIETLRQPVQSYLPIFAVFMLLVILAILRSATSVVIRVIRGKLSPDNVQDDLDRLQENESVTHTVIVTTKSSMRIKSVDAFRGIALLLMIFVNNGGGQYVFFNHSAWFGLTVADLVLPWFAWVMGLSITISKRAELRVTTSRLMIITRCIRRFVLLILLGLMVNSIHSKTLHDLRIPGVLQLLAVAYFVCTILETIFMKPHTQFGRFAMFRDIVDSWPQWLIMTCIVTTHTLITFLLPVPNCPSGFFSPGGKYQYYGKYENCTAGAAGYIDRMLFGEHMYPVTNDPVYGPIARHDPEGLMNTISAIFIVYLGVHAGKILIQYYQCNSRVIRWLLWAVLTGIVAGILCKFSASEGVIPISKKMMTLSYVLACSSLAFLLYTILYVLIDYKQVWSGAPFIYAGSNPIFIYVGHVLTKGLFPWAWHYAHSCHAVELIINLWTTVLWGLIGYVLYRSDVIITI
ncbi:heparan-alpha-glucosaminide N-acetyltransferase-like isoform X2 [Ceratina calcarata]|uniref:Heparan-alpha-glucosaminide N-acetyltransferase-like isoform X2 n=1 Tax=Ceratina calcarata TaxID=156304 RepID=A0AAJ7IYA9_9HYME|nr:heparan-alpha-glucosaminide N-acetyltransferase-like isoform X2 [Ceratina calcarata]